MKKEDVKVTETDELENPAESVFNCSISTTSKAINIHVTGYERATKEIADDVIKVVVDGFKKLTVDAAKAKREADAEIEAEIKKENDGALT